MIKISSENWFAKILQSSKDQKLMDGPNAVVNQIPTHLESLSRIPRISFLTHPYHFSLLVITSQNFSKLRVLKLIMFKKISKCFTHVLEPVSSRWAKNLSMHCFNSWIDSHHYLGKYVSPHSHDSWQKTFDNEFEPQTDLYVCKGKLSVHLSTNHSLQRALNSDQEEQSRVLESTSQKNVYLSFSPNESASQWLSVSQGFLCHFIFSSHSQLNLNGYSAGNEASCSHISSLSKRWSHNNSMHIIPRVWWDKRSKKLPRGLV